ncbi:cell division protein FtsK [Solwaraspora sp. WMMD791]|uniref:cell division protein FtsK n=1 Tax=Solwaraspora sp. WMMD791 TaxID=3016086 RepID=UPI00249A1E14|nr:cell division protein FtsK [Solwaraspora sp. WMMD791]WFE27800.1 cell division protein FtsK [Solwaraspora sp. WMMD791]
MTSPNDDRFDWSAAEADLTTPAAGGGPGAEVVDLDAVRDRRSPRAGSDGTHFDVVLDESPQPGGTLVDPPPVSAGPDGRRPIIPAQLANWVNIRATVRDAAGLVAYRAGYHAVRSPRYAVLAAFWASVGAARLAGRHIRWWWLAEQTGLRQRAADAGDWHAWQKLHREVKATRAWRGLVLVVEAVTVGVAGPLLWAAAPWWATAAVGGCAVAWLARIGRPADRPIITPATVSGRFRRVNPDIILRAYYAAGLGHPDKAHQQIGFGSTMARDPSGTGSQVSIDLPYGKTFDDAVKARGAIASGLDVAVSQVFITRDPSSHRRHTLWVADRDPLAQGAGRTPLLRCKATDIWQPAAFGLDERGGKVTVDLMWNSVLIGAQPRQGKTFAARLLALYAALDPYVKLTVLDGGGKPDWRKFALVADRYAFGLAMTRDGDPAEIVVEALREIKADVQDRYERLSKLPVDICPEGKLTREIARDPKYRMPVRMVVLDEFQEYFDLGEVSKEIAGLLVYLVKVAPAAGVIFVDATQRPSGVGAGQVAQQFISFRDNHQVRFSLRTGSWQVSDLVLGAGANSEGYDSSTLLPSYKGVGILRGASDATPTVRTYLADADDAEKILTAARKLREAAGTLSGMAAGEDVTRLTRDVLADVRAVIEPGETGAQWEEIAARLAARVPEAYADTTAEAISAQVRAFGVRSVDVKRSGKALKGAKADDIDAAIARRKAA